MFFRRRQWHPTPVLLPEKSHGWRSLVGCSPWGHWGLDMTERLHFHFSLSCIGEGNGNPLWCSCLENPRDGGAWWAAVSGVAQSQTRLKWLSSWCKMRSGLDENWRSPFVVKNLRLRRHKQPLFDVLHYLPQTKTLGALTCGRDRGTWWTGHLVHSRSSSTT